MSQPLNTDDQLQEAIDALAVCSNKTEAAASLNIPRGTFNNRLKCASERNFKPSGVVVKNNEDTTKHRIATLEAQLSSYKREELTDKYIR